MSTMNIAGLVPVDDPSYRYRMPKLTAKVEGRGNGIKTVITNVVDIGLSLHRDPQEITKFFGCEIGSQTSFSADRHIVNGAHNAPDLQNHLSRYIENFVLCKQCRLPETEYKIKSGLISQKCAACGEKSDVDMTHKLTTFMIAQHKKAKEASKGDKSDKKAKKEKKASKDCEDETVAVGGATGAETPKKKKDGGEKKSKKKTEVEEDVQEDDEEADVVDNTDEVSDSAAAEGCIERLRNWRIENADAPVEILLEELRILQATASLKPRDKVIIYLGAFFSEACVTAGEIEAQKEILAKISDSSVLQRNLIAGFEWLCGTRFPEKLSKLFPVVLKKLYDEELVEEEIFVEWYGDTVRNDHSPHDSMISYETLEQLRTAAAPFMTWLNEAEEEDEED